MKFFIDTADLDEIRDLAATGLLDGVTTNPSLVAKTGMSFLDLVAEICKVVPGPVSAEVTATEHEAMMAEAGRLTKIAPNAQALLAAKAGAAFISTFDGRFDDIGTSGMDLIGDIVDIYRQYPSIATEVLVASVRSPRHVIDAARMGAHVATLPPAVLRQMYKHPLTDKGLEAFLADWQKTGQSIL